MRRVPGSPDAGVEMILTSLANCIAVSQLDQRFHVPQSDSKLPSAEHHIRCFLVPD